MNSNHTIYRYNGGKPDRSEREGITHVIVEDGVESIDDEAFEDWIDLVSIYIPSSVRRFGQRSFSRCKSLSSIILPDSLKQIGKRAFYGCERLSTIVLSHSLNEIGTRAFSVCTSLVKISIPPSITRIESYTFEFSPSLSEIIIPPSVICIDDSAFQYCRSLKSIKLPNGIQKIRYYSFYRCTSLESIQIPPSTTFIGQWAFGHCSSLKVVYTPSTALQQHYYTFDNCDSNLIILTDQDGFEYRGSPSITLNNIHQCIQDLDLPNNSNNPIPPNQQLQALRQVLHQRFPNIAHRAQYYGLNLLHLIIYFPGDIYEPLSTLLTKCPEAITAVDSNGKTPIHHVITSTRHNMHPNCYNLLMRHCPDTVVHEAIRTWGLCWDDLYELVDAKIDALTLEDEESGLLPFMLAASSSLVVNDDGFEMSVVYGLLCMNPGVLKDY